MALIRNLVKIKSGPAAVKRSFGDIPLGNWEGVKTMNLSRNTCHYLRIHFTDDRVVLFNVNCNPFMRSFLERIFIMLKIFKIILGLLLLFTTGCTNQNITRDVVTKQEAKVTEETGIVAKQEAVTNAENLDQSEKADQNNEQVSESTKSKNNDTNNLGSNNQTTNIQIDDRITVSITIECKTLLNNHDSIKPGYRDFVPKNGVVLTNNSVKVEKGTTVMDLLKSSCDKQGISYKITNGYVQEIAYLPQKILDSVYDSSSGWMYSVNGKYVNMAATKKELNEGDQIKWMYTLKGGNDLSWS